MARADKEAVKAEANIEEVKKAEPKKEKTVTVHLPRPARGEDNFQFVGLNGKGYKIQKGVDVEVPAGVAEILENSRKMREQAADRIEAIAR